MKVDLRHNCPPVYDQGDLGSCTANAIGAAIEFDQIKQGMQPWVPSRLFIYYNERVVEGTVNEDAGAEIRDGIKVVNSQGVCPELNWPYNPSQFTTKPILECYDIAKQHPAVLYHSVNQDLHSLQQVLASGFPVVFGFTVYESFESDVVAKTGIMGMPKRHEQTLGGHAVLCVGYDNAKKQMIVRNSWGPTWGDQGYFHMPFDYITDKKLASDFWVIQSVK